MNTPVNTCWLIAAVARGAAGVEVPWCRRRCCRCPCRSAVAVVFRHCRVTIVWFVPRSLLDDRAPVRVRAGRCTCRRRSSAPCWCARADVRDIQQPLRRESVAVDDRCHPGAPRAPVGLVQLFVDDHRDVGTQGIARHPGRASSPTSPSPGRPATVRRPRVAERHADLLLPRVIRGAERAGRGERDGVDGARHRVEVERPRVNPEQSTCLQRMPGSGPSSGQSRDELSRLRFCSLPPLLNRVVVRV